MCLRPPQVMVGLEEELEGVEESYRPITAIHHQLRAQNVAAFDEIGIEKIFDIGMIGVERTGLGISTNLIRQYKSKFYINIIILKVSLGP